MTPIDCRSSVHGIFQVRILEWVVIPFSRGSSQLRDQTWVSCIAGRFLTVWATREVHWNLRKTKQAAGDMGDLYSGRPCRVLLGFSPLFSLLLLFSC